MKNIYFTSGLHIEIGQIEYEKLIDILSSQEATPFITFKDNNKSLLTIKLDEITHIA